MNESIERKQEREKIWGSDHNRIIGGRWWDYTTFEFNKSFYAPPIAFDKNIDEESKTP